ncbi:nucleotidyltransferase family protein [Nitrosococcus wardiae]|uniref:Nucleotidyltransferase n=1 Tax=Nitrosococcus wardiae TaxID=1814290 RepID=A0A4P7BTR0_9GAMM|nr:nucleotidyltransferase family protein [Nitrosococcus wardiae]QBQ53268.1 nucleotidyltransferase [Nitrosococcus wardiae]
MRPSIALRSGRETILRVATRHGLSNVRVFGSVVHGNDTDNSDLDLLVDIEPDTSLLDLVKAQHEIEDALGISVDLLTSDDLPDSFRSNVLTEAVPV